MPTIQGTDGDTTGIDNTASGGGAWTLVERKIILVDAQSYTFGVEAEMDGDLDEVYYLSADLIGGVGSAGGLLSVQPNGITTNQRASGVGNDAGSPPPFDEDRAAMALGYVPVAGRRAVSTGTFFAKTGSDRMLLAQSGIAQLDRSSTFSSRWLDTATNITTLTVFSASATGLGVGAVLELYKRTR